MVVRIGFRLGNNYEKGKNRQKNDRTFYQSRSGAGYFAGAGSRKILIHTIARSTNTNQGTRFAFITRNLFRDMSRATTAGTNYQKTGG